LGTRYEDQPTEQWAGPESLDPTPVWKQYALVGILHIVGLVVLVIVAVAALAPQFVTPPALVPGDRLVLATKDIRDGATRIGAPLLDEARAVWIVKVVPPGTIYALATTWSPRVGDAPCAVTVDEKSGNPKQPGFVASCGITRKYYFGSQGQAVFGTNGYESRDLDRYLVSVSGDRVIVNLSRVIRPEEPTNAPVPTGIPQPQQAP
jgi:hypothetical protein